MGVNPFTIVNWEKGRTEPLVPFVPAIRRFLGYDPYPEPQTLSERMLAKRRGMGWTIAETVRPFGVDEGIWISYEKNPSVDKNGRAIRDGRSA